TVPARRCCRSSPRRSTSSSSVPAGGAASPGCCSAPPRRRCCTTRCAPCSSSPAGSRTRTCPASPPGTRSDRQAFLLAPPRSVEEAVIFQPEPGDILRGLLVRLTLDVHSHEGIGAEGLADRVDHRGEVVSHLCGDEGDDV